MKKHILFLFVSLLMLSGCSMSDIFSGSMPGVISPISDDGSEVIYSGSNPYNSHYHYPGLIARLVGVYPGSESLHGAMVINSQAQLNSFTLEGKEYTWPEIDFKKYSLVVGASQFHSHGFRYGRFRVKKEKNSIKLYVEVLGTGTLASPDIVYFAVLFPKLPDGPVEFIRLDLDD